MVETLDFFFYGTLRDPDVRDVVIGADIAYQLTDGRLPGHRTAPVEGGRFPAIQPDPKSAAVGVLASGLTLQAAARLSYFEGEGYDYGVGQYAVEMDSARAIAWIFPPSSALKPEAGVWDMEEWRRTHKAGFLAKATETMAAYDDGRRQHHESRWQRRLANQA